MRTLYRTVLRLGQETLTMQIGFTGDLIGKGKVLNEKLLCNKQIEGFTLFFAVSGY